LTGGGLCPARGPGGALLRRPPMVTHRAPVARERIVMANDRLKRRNRDHDVLKTGTSERRIQSMKKVKRQSLCTFRVRSGPAADVRQCVRPQTRDHSHPGKSRDPDAIPKLKAGREGKVPNQLICGLGKPRYGAAERTSDRDERSALVWLLAVVGDLHGRIRTEWRAPSRAHRAARAARSAGHHSGHSVAWFSVRSAGTRY